MGHGARTAPPALAGPTIRGRARFQGGVGRPRGLMAEVFQRTCSLGVIPQIQHRDMGPLRRAVAVYRRMTELYSSWKDWSNVRHRPRRVKNGHPRACHRGRARRRNHPHPNSSCGLMPPSRTISRRSARCAGWWIFLPLSKNPPRGGPRKGPPTRTLLFDIPPHRAPATTRWCREPPTALRLLKELDPEVSPTRRFSTRSRRGFAATSSPAYPVEWSTVGVGGHRPWSCRRAR